MRLKISRSKNAASLYVMKSTYINKVHSTKIVEKLGTYAELKEKLDGRDPIEWAKEYIEELNRKEKENRREIIVKYSPLKKIRKNDQKLFNGGYLFLQYIYNELKFPNICKKISQQARFKFDLNSILSRLIFARILFPSSKLATLGLAKKFIEQPNFELHHIYRALGVLCKKSDFIQTCVYKNSLKLTKRNDRVLFYDCTNYFFEIEQAKELKQYGVSKEHRPNPIVQMGLFMDGDGFPLAFSMNKGNANEQTTLKPLEKKILRDFQLSKLIVCTDAGLSSEDNRIFNSIQNRAFITTQPLKKLKSFLKEWALNPRGWRLPNSKKQYDISEISMEEEKYKDKVFYKERWINENEFEQKIIVTYSIKYKNYKQKIRQMQVERALNTIEKNPSKFKKSSANSHKRFIKQTSCTDTGEVAEKTILSLNQEVIDEESMYDGFYAVCTNLEDSPASIIETNRRRWEIEECFRIMKNEFKARPVYLSRDDRIKAHFLTCYLALLLYRLLEKKLEYKFTCNEIIDNLREMNFYEIKGEGIVPTYIRNDFTDALHKAFGFRTDFQIIPNKQLKKIIKNTKKVKTSLTF